MSVQIQKKKTWLKELVKELRRLIEVLEYDTIHVKHEVGKKILPLYHKGKIQRGTITKIAEGIGWSRQEVHRCIKFARKYPTPQDAIRELSHICDSLTWYNICEFLLPDERRPTPPLPEGSFDVVYADPPWRYEVDWLDASPNSHYPTMTTEEICRLEVPERCSENAVLFLWTTNPMLEEALEVMKAWGFQYKTNLVWVKDRFGLGFFVRGQHELLLVGVKGSVHPPGESNRFSSVLKVPVKKHSEKPEEVYGLIENMYPNARKIELFARKIREGWEAWGLEVE